MPIDLGTMNGPPAVAGQYLERFGGQLENTGKRLMNLSSGLQQGAKTATDALEDAEVFNEVMKAKSLVYDTMNAFDAQIESNPDHKNYLKNWNDTKLSVDSQLPSILLRQAAKEKFGDWWMTKAANQYGIVAEKARGKLAAESEAQAVVAIEDASRGGDQERVLDVIHSAFDSGVWTREQATSHYQKYYPQAHYNDVYRQLDGIGNPDEAQMLLMAEGADERFGLTTSQLKDMTEAFNFKGERSAELAEKARLADAAKKYDSFMARWDADEVTEIGEIRSALAATVGTSYETGVRRIMDKWNTVYGAGLEARVAKEQDTKEYQLMNQMYAWQRAGGQGDSPWDTATLEKLFSESKLRDDQLDGLRKAFEAGDQPKAVLALRSRLYAAMEPTMKDGKQVFTNPAFAVSIPEIDRAADTGELGTGDTKNANHRELLALRESLQKSFESGLNKTSEQAEFDAASTVYDTRRLLPDREQWLRDNRARFSGDDYSKWLGRLNLSAGSEVRGNIMSQISTLYQKAMGTNAADNKKLATQSFDALNDMEKYMVETADRPNKEDLWNAKLHEMLGNKRLQELQQRTLAWAGATGFPFTATVEAGRARELETAAEAGFLGEYATESVEYEKIRPTALKQEREALSAKRIKPVDMYENPERQTIYVDVNGRQYQVFNRNVGGTVREVVFELVVVKDDKGKEGLVARPVP